MTKAFTLIELLVVVLIIGILSAIALPQYRVAVIKARLVQAMVLGNALMQAQQVYHLANGTYATKFGELDISVPEADADASSVSASWGYCALIPDTGEIDCVTHEEITYAAFPSSGQKRCRWYQNNNGAPEAIKEKVCLNITGAAASSKGTSQEHNFSQYAF